MTNYSPIEKEESPIRLGTGDLTIEQVVRVARFQCQVLEVGPASSETASQVVYERVIASRSWVEDVISENEKKEA